VIKTTTSLNSGSNRGLLNAKQDFYMKAEIIAACHVAGELRKYWFVGMPGGCVGCSGGTCYLSPASESKMKAVG